MAKAEKKLALVPRPEKETLPETGRIIAKSHLVNRLNYLNFQDQTILVGLRHVAYENAVTLRAKPKPCGGERLGLTWAEVPSLRQLLSNYRFEYLLIPDGKKYLLVNPEVISLGEEGLSCVLPATCREFQLRKIKRHRSSGVLAQLSQHGALFQGEVLDFTPVSLKAQVLSDPPDTFHLINPETPLHLSLSAGDLLLYSGPCEILWQSSLRSTRTIVLGEFGQNIRRFREKRHRNKRQQLVPSPSAVFEHPLIGRKINLKVVDLSGSGFAVEESAEESVLLPGMMVQRMRLTFAQGVSLSCQAQVVYRNPACEPGSGLVRCGVAILKMDVGDHVKLLSILHQAADRKSYVDTEVDLDELWNFFFETGFLYPEKYTQFQAHKDAIKETYARLYEETPQIARHFIYRDRGVILGHMAMVRCYRNSWLIHHHAARSSVALRAGIAVLEQIGEFLNELGNNYCAHLEYVFCYYRPGNRFPTKVFGGFARQQGNPQVCSLDSFGYARFHGGAVFGSFPEPWDFGVCTPFDHGELASFYAFASGGLMMDAFDLQPGDREEDQLAGEYRRLGLRKESHCYALRKEGSLKAFFLVNCTDAGFNLADLTNCVTLLVLDEGVPPELVRLSLERVSRHYQGGEMPVLTFPVSYLERQALPVEKTYQLWVLNLKHSDEYFTYCDGLFKRLKGAAT